jgi:hypothetical protein
VVAGLPYLDGIEENRAEVSQAVDLLETIRGIQRLGLSGFSVRDLTGWEFALVSYLSARLDEYQSKKR